MARRRYLILGLVLLLLALGAWVLQRVLFPEPAKTLEVLSVRGDVSVIDPVTGNSALTAGAKVGLGATVRTGHEGEAILKGGGDSTVTLSEHTRARLDGVTADGVSKIHLDEGRVRAVAKEGAGGGVEVSGGSDGGTVLTRGGDVAVGIDGSGSLAVAAFAGKATVSGAGSTRELTAGQQAIVSKGGLQVGSIPTAVLLKVAWPEIGKTRDATAHVHVEAPAGATVRIGDAAVTLSSSGEATVALKLEEGENRLHMEAQDVSGNRKTEDSGVIELDTRPPVIKGGKTTWK